MPPNMTEIDGIWTKTPEYYTFQSLVAADLWEARLAFVIVAYATPAIIVIGTVLNMATTIVVSRGRVGSISTRILLIVLSVSDTAVLYVGCLDFSLTWANDFVVRTISNFFCKLHMFLMDFTLMFSSWCILMLSIERFICVMFPLKARFICTKKVTYISILGVALALAALNCHTIVYVKITAFDYGTWCSPDPADVDYNEFATTTFTHIRMAVHTVVPVIVIAAADTCIVRKLLISMRKREVMQDVDKVKKDSNLRSITIMLVVVGVVFIILALPNDIFFVVEDFYFPILPIGVVSADHEALYYLVRFLTRAMLYSNNAINFVLYCISGSQFRRAFFKQIRDLGNKLSSFR
jgi:hypothetical protein